MRSEDALVNASLTADQVLAAAGSRGVRGNTAGQDWPCEPFQSEEGLDVYLLGSLGIYRGARRVCSQLPPKALALFTVLLADAPQRFRREQLAGLLWPNMDPETARNNLRRVLHILR